VLRGSHNTHPHGNKTHRRHQSFCMWIPFKLIGKDSVKGMEKLKSKTSKQSKTKKQWNSQIQEHYLLVCCCNELGSVQNINDHNSVNCNKQFSGSLVVKALCTYTSTSANFYITIRYIIHKKMVGFQKLFKNLFLTIQKNNITVNSGNCPNFSCVNYKPSICAPWVIQYTSTRK
jgi:hypothetical protein